MASKPASRSKAKTGKAAPTQHGKETEGQGAKTKTGFGKRSMAAGVARKASVQSKPAKPHIKTQQKSVIGKAVEAVTSTVSSAAALFKRRPAKSH